MNDYASHLKSYFYLFIYLFLFFIFGRAAGGILAPRPGIEPAPLAVKAQSPNHRTAREFPKILFLKRVHVYDPN